MKTQFRSALTALLSGSMAVTGLAACTDSDPPEVGVNEGVIIGGFPAVSARFDAVGALGVPAEGGTWDPYCTATLISPTAVITAEHCVGNVTGTRFLIGADARTPKRAVPVLGAAFENTLSGGFVGLGADVAIVHLAEPVTDIQPVALGTLDPSMVGKRLIAMGYGYQDNNGKSGTRFLGSETFNGVGGNFLDYLFGDLARAMPRIVMATRADRSCVRPGPPSPATAWSPAASPARS